MFCHKCGTQMDDQSRFCTICGSSRLETTPTPPSPPEITYAPPSAPQQPYSAGHGDYGYQPGNVQPSVKTRKPWKVLLPICAVLVAAIGIAAYFLIFASPSMTVGMAMSGLKDEMSDRLNVTPLNAISILPDTLKDGELSVEFDYIDYWGDKTYGTVTLQSDEDNRDYAILADMSLYGQSVDIDAYINKNRIALHSTLLDSNYYGFEYETFRSDITSFGALVGLDDYTMDMLADSVEAIDEMMNMDSSTGLSKEYSKPFTDFMGGLETQKSKALLPFGNSGTTYQKIDYVVTKADLLKLLDDYYVLLRNDADLRAQLDSYYDTMAQYGVDPYYDLGVSFDYDEFLHSFDDMIETFDREYTGVTYLSFYLDSKRLVALTVQSDIEIDGDTASIDVVCDFGLSVGMPWEITITLMDDHGYEEAMTILWEYSEDGGRFTNEITFSSDNAYSNEFTLYSNWSSSSGAFTLAYDDGYNYGEITGNYKETANGFVLRLDNLADEYYDELLEITITAEKGVKIDNPSFINIDKWDEDLLYLINDMFYNMY